MKKIGQKDRDFFASVRSILHEARQKAYANVNAVMVEAYWKIGERIVHQEQGGEAKAAYGEGLLKSLSRELTAEFGKGFSYANLRNFRQFYLTYSVFEKCYTLCSKLSWSHNRLIMRVESDNARIYYLKEAAGQGWSVREFERQIRTQTFQRLLSTGKNPSTETRPIAKTATNHFIKDPYVLEFLGAPESEKEHENDLETAIIAKIQNFLLELGKGFSFVGRQFRISTETRHFTLTWSFTTIC